MEVPHKELYILKKNQIHTAKNKEKPCSTYYQFLHGIVGTQNSSFGYPFGIPHNIIMAL